MSPITDTRLREQSRLYDPASDYDGACATITWSGARSDADPESATVWLPGVMPDDPEIPVQPGQWIHFDPDADPRFAPVDGPPADSGLEAYKIRLHWLGDEGGMVAFGHVPLRRFAAACNKVTRVHALRDEGLDMPLAGFLAATRHLWAFPVRAGADCDWGIHWAGATARTPHALPITLYWP